MKTFRYFLYLAANWAVSIGWHLLMVARLRPQVALINDGPRALLSFALPYLGAGLLRWHVIYGGPVEKVLLSLLAGIVIVGFLSSWGPWRLVSMYLAISTVVDLAAVLLVMAGVPAESLRSPWTQIAEILMFLNVCRVWKQTTKTAV